MLGQRRRWWTNVILTRGRRPAIDSSGMDWEEMVDRAVTCWVKYQRLFDSMVSQ